MKIKLITIFYLLSTAFGAITSLDAHELDIANYSLTELMNIEVESPSKKAQSRMNTPAALTIITRQDIERSGIHRLQELFRMVPGMQVAMVNNNNWAISVRGFNRLYSKKLLVMIDGRTIYSPVSAGVIWAAQNVMLQDIERIEVIRGPGASVWGSNAVNGVVNILTRSAKDTPGEFVSLLSGTETRYDIESRYGRILQGDQALRFYVKAGQFDQQIHQTPKHSCPEPPVLNRGDPARDELKALQAGFRMDGQADLFNSYHLQGDIYDNGASQSFYFTVLQDACTRTAIDPNYHLQGVNLLAEWTSLHENRSQTRYFSYIDRARRHDILFKEKLDTVHVEVNHRFFPADYHDTMIGGAVRYRASDSIGSFPFSINPNDHDDSLINLFVQDEMSFHEDFTLVAGLKLEHNEYTGLEPQPTLRGLWRVNDRNSLWVAISRAARIPSRVEVDGTINIFAFRDGAGNTHVGSLLGNSNFNSEILTAYETGWRAKLNESLFLDTTAFYFDYSNQADTTPLPPKTVLQPIPYIQEGQITTNSMDTATYGMEMEATYQPSYAFKAKLGYSLFQQKNVKKVSINVAEETPEQQAFLQLFTDIKPWLHWDTSTYFTGRLSRFDIPSYIRVDTRLSWEIASQWELTLAGQNLFDDSHPEYTHTSLSSASEIERRAYLQISVHLP